MKNRLQIKYHIPESLPTREEAIAYLDNFFTYSGTSLPAEPLVLLYNNNPLDVSNGITEDIRLKTSNVLLAIGRGGDGKNIENNQKYFLIDFAKHEESLISLNEEITNLDSVIKETILEKISQLNTEFKTADIEINNTLTTLGNNLTAVEGRVAANEQAIAALQAADAEINGTLATLGNNLTTVEGKVTANEQAIAALQATDETIRGEFEAADAEINGTLTTLGNHLTTVEGKVTANEQAIEALKAADETIRGEFKAADAELNCAISSETEVREKEIALLQASISLETSNRATSDSNLQTLIYNEISERENAIAELDTAIEFEKSEREDTITELQNSIFSQLNNAISSEAQARENAVSQLNNAISSETQERKTSVSNLQKSIQNEKTERETADAELSDRIDTINTSIVGVVHFIGIYESLDDIENAINGDIAIVENKEYIYSKSEDEEIGSWIELGDTTSETERISALENSVEEITTAVQNEKSERESADIIIQAMITDEIENRVIADENLNDKIDAEIEARKSSVKILRKEIEAALNGGGTSVSSYLDEDIIVTGLNGNLGGYKNGDLIPSGTTFSDIFKNIFKNGNSNIGTEQYFLGNIEKYNISDISYEDIISLDNKGYLNADGITTVIDNNILNVFTSNGKSIIIACPENYEIKTITNSCGIGILNNFIQTTLSNENDNYNIYLYPITNNVKVQYNNLIIGLKTNNN